MPWPGGEGFNGTTETAPPVYKRGRQCRYPGCKTILSIYNEEDWCAQHLKYKPEPPPRELAMYFKKCQGQCNEWKDGHAYAFDQYAPDRLDYICKACRTKEATLARWKAIVAKENSGTKCCSICGEDKPATLDYFGWNKTNKGHLNTYCLVCGK